MSAAPLDPTAPAAGPGPDEGALHDQLTRVWGTPKGLYGWLAATDHKLVGRRYMVTVHDHRVAEFVDKHPEESVSIIRSWLHESA